MTLETKKCKECKIVKSVAEFNKGQAKCKPCKSQYQKERAEKLKAENSLLTIEQLWAKTPEKKCGKCKQVLPSTQFSRHNSTKSGLQDNCRACGNADSSATRTRYIKQNESLSLADLRERTLEKNCWKCEQTLPSTEFNRTNSMKSGLSAECRDCGSERNSEWFKNNPEKNREKNARYRAKKKGLFWKDMSLNQILKRDGLACAWCSVIPNAYHIDHVRPLDLDGIHMPDNLVASCVSCNTSKGAQEPAVWLSKRLREGCWNIPSPSALKAVQLAYSGVHEELKTKIDSKNQMALAA